ncbi:glycoside hydrolase family 18 protein [Terrimonas sp. NA20]|uniref:chitinase n=1 Tax=Terrimonas ginsenosidimutans TaxID=2908004 RepID=A0ABS9KX58_9BACT|nr:glycoside hydrolase family 18 protein [Terrimonas ginsenosidimutans]MCG2616905.1 glycoside hydrolase family 18 protein [Terrimonas ginsenosidimutans]
MQRIFYCTLFVLASLLINAQTSDRSKNSQLQVIAYYSGNASQLAQYPVEKLTHIIYSFCHLKGSRLNVDNANDTLTIRTLIKARQRNPSLKVMLSLGGWGGCEQCSPVFASELNRKEFASSVKELCDYFGADGIDLDWEYPAIKGHPGHPYSKDDRQNFTSLIQSLRDSLGSKREISFAAGGLDNFLQESVEWLKVTPLVDRINLMSYDLVGGFDTVTGHHTPLYSNKSQISSADHAIRYLIKTGVPADKIVIGAAFYARTWINVASTNNGLYQAGRFKSFIPYHSFEEQLSKKKGFVFYYDNAAKASYAYNAKDKVFATFDDERSIGLKTSYAIKNKLNGIMFWELTLDKPSKGYVDLIDSIKSTSSY